MTLTFDATDTEFTVSVPIIDDLRLENNEDFRARLMLTAPSTQVFVDPANATVTITDNDSEPCTAWLFLFQWEGDLHHVIVAIII